MKGSSISLETAREYLEWICRSAMTFIFGASILQRMKELPVENLLPFVPLLPLAVAGLYVVVRYGWGAFRYESDLREFRQMMTERVTERHRQQVIE
jgi:hypothetical protein